jgi:hypothetical protein
MNHTYFHRDSERTISLLKQEIISTNGLGICNVIKGKLCYKIVIKLLCTQK